MDNLEAVKHIKEHMKHHGISLEKGHHVHLCEALHKAINALEVLNEQESGPAEPCELEQAEPKQITLKEYVRRTHPDNLGYMYVAGIEGCPISYGFTNMSRDFCKYPGRTMESKCTECWNRLIDNPWYKEPETKAEDGFNEIAEKHGDIMRAYMNAGMLRDEAFQMTLALLKNKKFNI